MRYKSNGRVQTYPNMLRGKLHMYKEQDIQKYNTLSNVMAPYCNTHIFRRNESIFPALLQKPLTPLI